MEAGVQTSSLGCGQGTGNEETGVGAPESLPHRSLPRTAMSSHCGTQGRTADVVRLSLWCLRRVSTPPPTPVPRL